MAEDGVAAEPPVAVDYYTVLNVNRGASQAEINERHRALSLLFHPDKQRDPRTVDAATEEFLKVQKAYQVLSDPFLREVYDALGERGIAIRWPPEFASQSLAKLREELKEIARHGLEPQGLDDEPPFKNVCAATIDGTSLFYGIGYEPTQRPLQGYAPEGLLDRLNFTIYHQDISHTLTKRINSSTAVGFGTHATIQSKRFGLIQYIGTVRHQFSPRFSGKANLIYGQTLVAVLSGQYQDDANTVAFNTSAAPLLPSFTPTVDITYARQLFPKKPQKAVISLKLHQLPSLSLNYAWPSSLSQDLVDANVNGLPSTSGFKQLAVDRSVGIEFTEMAPRFVCDIGVTVLELATRFHAGFFLGFTGLQGVIGGHWTQPDGRELHVTTTFNGGNVLFQVDFTLWKQRLKLPILLASEYNPVATVCSVVIPSTVAVLGYYFIIRPRRRAHRIAKIRAARQVLEEDSDARRKRNTVIDLLKDSARKVMSSEAAKGGLVIQDAFYGVIDTQDGGHELTIDVTVAVQALVRNSQLHIPSEGSKANLQGFSDPAPFTAKCLRIHYLFRGRPHFVEVPDYLPVVLPLAEHEIGRF